MRKTQTTQAWIHSITSSAAPQGVQLLPHGYHMPLNNVTCPKKIHARGSGKNKKQKKNLIYIPISKLYMITN